MPTHVVIFRKDGFVWVCLCCKRDSKRDRNWGLDLGRKENKEEEEELGFEGKAVGFVGCS
ncbi:unnamed protein product [Prunus brigantina]